MAIVKGKPIPPFAWAVIATAVGLGVVWFLDDEITHKHQIEYRTQIVDKVGAVRARLEATLNSKLSLVEGMAALVKSNIELAQAPGGRFAEHFNAYTDELLKDVAGVRSLQLAPGGVVTYINPLKGNEAALGHDLMADPARKDAAWRAIREKKFIVAGPVKLRQGGVALIGRLPIILPPSDKEKMERFWGFSIILIDLQPLLDEAGLRPQSSGVKFAMRGRDGLGKEGAVFFGDGSIFDADPVIQDITLPNGIWQIAAFPVKGWEPGIEDNLALRIFGGLISFSFGLLFFVLLSGREKLATSENQYRGLIENSGLGIHLSKPEGGRLFINDALVGLLGYDSPEEIYAQPEFELVAPHDREKSGRYLAEASGIPGGYLQYECDFLRKDGAIIPLHVIISRITWDGVDAVQRTVVDVSERKQAEQEASEKSLLLEATFENMAQGFAVFDGDLKLVAFNPQYAEIAGFPVDGLRLGMTWEELIRYRADALIPEGVDLDEHIASRIESVKNGEISRRERTLPNGRAFFYERTPTPDGGYISAVTDITERKEAERKLQQAQKMEAVGQLTGGIAHDFNNLLAISMGNIELAEEVARDGGDVGPFLKTIMRASERGASLTNQLLAFSRRQTLFPQTIDAGELLDAMTGLLRSSLGETIEIKVTSEEDLWPCKVDPHQLESAVLNLALNARDAMPSGGALTLEITNVSLDNDYASDQADVEPGEFVLLAVIDTGMGMTQDMINQAFDPFFTTKGVGEGSGLGLSMVYGFAKQSGGHVTIHSDEAEGTTVKLYLPRSDKAENRLVQVGQSEIPKARGETVLVVEDDPEVRALAVALLSSFGYQILEAADGPSAVKALESTPKVDLLFTDVVLPGGMSGPELAARVRKHVPGMAVLYTSGYTDLANVDQSAFGEDSELLEKPYHKAALALKVRIALDQAQS